MTADGEDLRRRLYRRGAAQDDVAAYLAAVGPPPPAATPVTSPKRRPRRGRVLGGAAVLLAVATALLIGRTAPAEDGARAGHAAPPATAAPTPLPTSSVDPATRAAFVRKVAVGGDAGLAPWWDAGPGALEVHGAGSTTVRLPVAPSRGRGHLTVLLVLGADGTAEWTVARFVIHDDRTIHLAPVAGAAGALRAGIPTVSRVDYAAGARPQRLLVRVPEDTQWGLAVVDSVDNGPQLPDS